MERYKELFEQILHLFAEEKKAADEVARATADYDAAIAALNITRDRFNGIRQQLGKAEAEFGKMLLDNSQRHPQPVAVDPGHAGHMHRQAIVGANADATCVSQQSWSAGRQAQ